MSKIEPPSISRRLVQKRSIEAQVFRRDDGLWDVEAELVDTKGSDFKLAALTRKQGEPIHKMRLMVTINEKMDVIQASATTMEAPYPGQCEKIESAYQKLIGLNLMKGFRGGVKERLGGIKGCSHISELCSILPTAAIQAFAGEIFKISDTDDAPQNEEFSKNESQMPFQLNQCHALRTDGDAVKKYHPVWFGTSIDPRKN